MFHQPLDIFQIFFVARNADHQRGAGFASATGAANAVNVIFGMAGHIKVEDVAHIGNIQSTRRNVRGAKKLDIAIAKACQNLHPAGLIQIAVDWLGVIAVLFQGLGNGIHVNLAIAKHNRAGAGIALFFNQCAQKITLFAGLVALVGRAEFDHTLFDVFAGCCGTGHFDLGGVRQKRVGDPLDFRGHRSAEEQRLAGERCQRKDALDIGDKAHIQHPVSLVYHHDLNAGQHQLAALEMVQQTAGGGDQNVDATVDQFILFLEGNATNQQRLGQLAANSVVVKVFSNLRGQFPCGGQHKRAWHPRAGAATAKHGDHRQSEAGSFACACLGNAQNITSLKRGWNRTGLNGGRGFVTRGFDRF